MEGRRRRSAGGLGTQAALVWLATASLTWLGAVAAILLFWGMVLALPILAAILAVAAMTFALIAKRTPHAFPEPLDWPARIGWGVLVLAGGITLWLLLTAVASDLTSLYLHPAPLVMSGLPFAMVAAVLSLGWQPWFGALGLTLGSAAVVLVTVATTVLIASGSQEAGDIAKRLEHEGLTRETALVTEVPGYRPSLLRRDGQAYWRHDPASADLHLRIARQLRPEDCGPAATPRPAGTTVRPCVREGDMWYQAEPGVRHKYVRRHGSVYVVVEGSGEVSRATVRRAALAVRRATDAELDRMLPTPIDALHFDPEDWLPGRQRR